ncbi:MAG: phytanoyl-CoA dioxygenase family protein [Planctomycetes bacterium]|nr:phytanoyl-CoA dioxygenase family protein [Planctomycetota bacterium]
MPYALRDADVANYYKEGYIVFRQILPTALIRDLRRECEKALRIARRVSGAQAQRLQPVQQYADELDLRPFKDYADLPPLRAAIAALLTPRHVYGHADVCGVLFEPEHVPWCTDWHRDITLESSRLPAEDFQELLLDWNFSNQINCPLYDDACTWFVPGSHLRPQNLPGESAAAKQPAGVGWATRNADATAVDLVERERACLNYTQGMPGAVQLRLHAGDFCLYRSLGWHIGNYVPYMKRATLHDKVFTPEYEVWWRQWIKGGSPRWEKKATAAV